MSKEVTSQSIGQVFGKSECYLSNLSELAAELDEVIVEDDGSIIEFNVQGVVATAQVLWDKFKETAMECENREIRVKLPGGLVGTIISASLAAIGFRL